MSKKEKEKRKWDIKKLEKIIELESKKNLRWIIIGGICLGIAVIVTYWSR